jgi:hypothetical protein
MPINRLLEYEAFGPEDIKVLAKTAMFLSRPVR